MRAVFVLLAAGVACGNSHESRVLRQGTTSYQFNITSPNTPPVAGDEVTYMIVVRDRKTGQPIETGEGRIFARAAAGIAASLVKAPQVGQYRGVLRFPTEGGWIVGIRFRDQPTRELELTQWGQDVRSATPSRKMSWMKPPWLWRAGAKK